jgi:hypothetical protein
MRFSVLLDAIAAAPVLADCNVGSDKVMMGALDNETFACRCSLTDTLRVRPCSSGDDGEGDIDVTVVPNTTM